MPCSRTWSDSDLIRAVAESTTWAQVSRSLGLKSDGGTSSKKIRQVAVDLGLDTSHFLGRSWSKGTGKGRDETKQRLAKQRWYANNRQVYLSRNRERILEKRRKLRDLKNVPCADCGLQFPPYVMDFDHIDESKEGNISALLARWSWPRILAETQKCDIVCANCHRIRTARRAGWTN